MMPVCDTLPQTSETVPLRRGRLDLKARFGRLAPKNRSLR